MEARHPLRCCAVVALISGLGAGYRTANFVVSAPTELLAREVGEAAEMFRRELALEWLEHELPHWEEPCPITAQVNPQLGAGGETSFMFRGGQPFGWRMRIQGSRERILDSVLPHEVTHTIFATHFGQPLPRWADEGACTTVEHESERRKQEQWLVRFLHQDRGIPFNQMFVMTEYPPDIMPLYAQGYSVARFLIRHGGKPKFVRFVGGGLQSDNWNSAIFEHYGYRRVGDLQVAWEKWLGQGRPTPTNQDAQPQVLLASADTNREQPWAPGSTTTEPPRRVRPKIDKIENAEPDAPGWYEHQAAAGLGTRPRSASRLTPQVTSSPQITSSTPGPKQL